MKMPACGRVSAFDRVDAAVNFGSKGLTSEEFFQGGAAPIDIRGSQVGDAAKSEGEKFWFLHLRDKVHVFLTVTVGPNFPANGAGAIAASYRNSEPVAAVLADQSFILVGLGLVWHYADPPNGQLCMSDCAVFRFLSDR